MWMDCGSSTEIVWAAHRLGHADFRHMRIPVLAVCCCMLHATAGHPPCLSQPAAGDAAAEPDHTAPPSAGPPVPRPALQTTTSAPPRSEGATAWAPRGGVSPDPAAPDRASARQSDPEGRLRDGKSFICGCGKGFASKRTLGRHAVPLGHQTPYQFAAFRCASCGKPFSTNGQRACHERTHNPAKSHVCPDCGGRFAERYQLGRHAVRLGHSTAGQFTTFRCAVCRKPFPTGAECRRHEGSHRPESSRVCPQCGMRFLRPHALRRHITARHAQDPGLGGNLTAKPGPGDRESSGP
jgi:DNA-directed RNA polymerase subunit RPC12/RpoP